MRLRLYWNTQLVSLTTRASYRWSWIRYGILLVEADYFTRKAKRDAISRADVDDALHARIRRAARLRDRAHEAILEQVALIDTTGTHIGQVNGLSVAEFGGFAFGRPTRITVRRDREQERSSTSNVKSSLAAQFTERAF